MSGARVGDEPPDHFGRLLLMLLGVLLVSGGGESIVIRLASGALILASLTVAVTVTGLRGALAGWQSLLVVAAGVVGLGVAWVEAPAARAVSAGLGVASLGLVFVATMRRVLTYEEVGEQTLYGALCAYLLIGLVFSSAYRGLDALVAGPFLSGAAAPDYTYFSFVTLTTVGFGDVVPLTALGRRVTLLEGMAGQVFLATTVARLVSLFRGRRERATD